MNYGKKDSLRTRGTHFVKDAHPILDYYKRLNKIDAKLDHLQKLQKRNPNSSPSVLKSANEKMPAKHNLHLDDLDMKRGLKRTHNLRNMSNHSIRTNALNLKEMKAHISAGSNTISSISKLEFKNAVISRAKTAHKEYQENISREFYRIYWPMVRKEISSIKSNAQHGYITSRQASQQIRNRKENLQHRIAMNTEKKMENTESLSMKFLIKRESKLLRDKTQAGMSWQSALKTHLATDDFEI